jgi:pimeloyl-ACP methyl ester carboxylesterase
MSTVGYETITTFPVASTDGRRRHAVLVTPGSTEPVPLVLSPTPMGFTATANLFGSAAGRRTALDFPGLWPSALDRGVAVLSLESFGARLPAASLGWPAHLDAYAAAIETAGTLAAIDRSRIFACGISMGGLESLLLAGRLSPLIRAVAVQNAPVDLIALHEVCDADTRELVRTEIGGDPDTVRERYLERGAARYRKELAAVAVQLRLNDQDRLVTANTQGRALGALLCAAGGFVQVCDDEPFVPPGVDAARAAHEHINWPALLDFVLAQGGRAN